MKKFILLAIIIFYTINVFSKPGENKNYTFYTDGGDTLQFTIKNNKLYLTDEVVLNYQPSKKNFYFKKIINSDVYKNYDYWGTYKEEYFVSTHYASNQLESISLTVKTYFGRNRLINFYTKKFNRINNDKGKYLLSYKLVKQYKDHKKYCGAAFPDKNLLKYTVTNEEEGIYVEPHEKFKFILNNDNTITIDPEVFSYFITVKGSNKFSGASEFGSCGHDHSYTNIEKVSDKIINIFQYSGGNGGSTISCGKYELTSKTKIDTILFNDILTGKLSLNAGYITAEE